MAFVFGALTEDDEQCEPADSPEANPGLPAFFRFALPALGIWIAVQVLPLAPSEYYAERARESLSDWKRLVSPDAARELETRARRGLEWNPSNPELYFALGEAQSNLGDLATDQAAKDGYYTQSLDAYRKALEFSPRDVSTVISLAGSLDSLRRFSESDPLFQRTLELDPGSSIVHNAYAAHLDLEGKLVEAAAHFRLASQLGGGPASEIGLERVTDEQKTKSAP
jgi:tetratricopeptide (TPR) repeat protein